MPPCSRANISPSTLLLVYPNMESILESNNICYTFHVCCFPFSVEFLPQITTLLTDLGASQAEVGIIKKNHVALNVFYSTANDSQPGNDLQIGQQMIPDVDCKWFCWQMRNGMECGFLDFFNFFKKFFLI